MSAMENLLAERPPTIPSMLRARQFAVATDNSSSNDTTATTKPCSIHGRQAWRKPHRQPPFPTAAHAVKPRGGTG